MSSPDDPFAAPGPDQPHAAPPGGYGQAPPPSAPPPAGGPGPYGQQPPPPPPGGYAPPPGPGGHVPPPPAPGGHPPPQYGYAPPPQQGTNGMAIASIICSVAGLVTCGISAVVGIVLGFVAKGQIKRTGQDGRGLAIAGIWVGAVVTFLAVVVTAIAVGFAIWAVDKADDCNAGEYGPPLSQTWFDAGCDDFTDWE